MGGYTHYHPNAAERYNIQDLSGNYADLVRALGGFGEPIEEFGQIRPAIERALSKNAEGIPVLLEIITCEESRMARDLPVPLIEHHES